jgi:hypothetical protein
VAASNLVGGCHCGALEVQFSTELPIEQLEVRACQCSFCRAHGALSVTDPQGLLTFRASDSSQLVRYQFGLKLADFLLCSRCGTYVGAYMEDGGRGFGVLNICALRERDRFGTPVLMRYDGETAQSRIQRRRQRWTPARLLSG